MVRRRRNQQETSMTNDENQSSNLKSRTSIGNDFEEQFHEEQGTQIIDDIYMPPPPVQTKNLEDQTGRRLIIETIEIINFKSYGGKSVLGPFYKSFNAIVGPNGSGKSNVIDSMLFVFGYRAQKLRSNKISSIIHNSEQLPNCEYAQVDVNFAMIDDKGDENLEIIQGSRFTISRVVNKDNSSYYMIDNRRSMFKDVSKRLQDYGIDLRYNRFLILQGEVEQISLMKPKADVNNDVGMLEYLEDIIGTSRYKDPIEKLSIKYNEFNEKRTHCVNRVNLSHKELKAIEEAKCEAVRALELENQKKIEKSKVIQFHLYQLNNKLEKQEAEYSEFEQQLDLFTKEEENIRREKLELDEDEKTKNTDFNRIQKELEELKVKFNECTKNDYYINQKYKTTKDKLRKLKNKIVEDEKKFEQLQEMPSHNDEQIKQMEKSKIKMESELKQVEESINMETDMAQQECSDLIQHRDQLNLEFMKFKDEQTGKLNQMNEAYNQFMIYKHKTDSTRDKYEQLQLKMKQVTEETGEKSKMIVRYQKEIPVEKTKLKDFQRKYEKMEENRVYLTEAINKKNEELHELKESITKLQSRDAIRNALMDAKRKGTLQGIFGRLGDLGAIDKRYDIAVSTACGRLKNFVVDTIENAQRCVEFLKQNNLPPVTLIALDKLRVQWKDQVSYPENVPRLFDLIRINDVRIRPAFYYALGETLVAKDIDQAKRITRINRFRIVTERGDLIEFEGAMTGGGKPKFGGMGQSISEIGYDEVISQEELAKLELEIGSLHEKRQSIDYEIDSVRENISKLEKDIMFMDEKLNSFQLEVKDSDTRLNQIKDNLEQQRIELEKIKDDPKLDAAEREYQKSKAIYEKEMSKMDAIQEEMKQLDDQIKEKLDRRLGPLKKKRKILEKILKESQLELNQLLSEKKANELNLKKAVESLSNDEKNKQETEEEIENIMKQIAELEVTAKEITEKYEQAQEQCQMKEQELNDIKAKVREADVKLNKIKNDKLDLKLETDKRFKFLKEKRDKAARYRAELESIKLNPIDDIQEDDDEESEPKTTNDPDTLMEVDEVPETPPKNETYIEGDVLTDSFKENAFSKISNRRKKPTNNANRIPILTPEELEVICQETIERTIKSIETELEKLSPNFAAIEEFRKKRREYRLKVADLDDITTKRDTYMEHLKETKNRRLKEFKTGFIMIARKLKELYRTITLGGDADLEFIDSLDPFSEGINFAVRPNKKSWKNNINLSGGEKTLASLALIFALHYYKPSPLYIMDEIDAALDFKNVSIIANYIKKRTRNTQFLIISLRNNMYELADRLIGIYKTFNITKSIPFDPVAFDRILKQDNTAIIANRASQKSPVID